MSDSLVRPKSDVMVTGSKPLPEDIGKARSKSEVKPRRERSARKMSFRSTASGVTNTLKMKNMFESKSNCDVKAVCLEVIEVLDDLRCEYGHERDYGYISLEERCAVLENTTVDLLEIYTGERENNKSSQTDIRP